MIKDFVKLCARFYTFPIPTVAAVNGHAFGGGLMLALSHDYRYMNKQRGNICMPEINLQMTIPPSMTAIVKTRCPSDVYSELMYGDRFNATEAESMRLVTKAVDLKDLMTVAMIKAKHLREKDVNRINLQKIKFIAFKEVYDNCMLDKSEIDVQLPSKFGWAKL